MWKMKKRMWPKKKSTLPVAKLNQVKKLMSSLMKIKAALYQEYQERLIKRKVRPDFQQQKDMDEKLVELKINENKNPEIIPSIVK